MKWIVNIVFVLIVVFFSQCAKNVNHQEDLGGNSTNGTFNIPAYGELNTLEIATWNLENFPIIGGNIDGSPDPEREKYFQTLLSDLKIDLIGVEEVNYPQNLKNIINQFDSLEVVISSENVTQHVGLIYNKLYFSRNASEPVTLLFETEDYYFPRAPLEVPMTIQNSGINFSVIVLHLKANTSNESKLRRETALNMLLDYAKGQIAQSNKKFIILGDFNSDVDNEPYLINTFINDPDFVVLSYDSLELVNENYYATYPRYTGSIIDHIVISKNLLNQMQLQDVETLRLDDYLKDYLNTMSDHRPVAMKFSIK
jgi:endonuclease/exonuclease/phosphatase family metal-dependent hydrolase